MAAADTSRSSGSSKSGSSASGSSASSASSGPSASSGSSAAAKARSRSASSGSRPVAAGSGRVVAPPNAGVSALPEKRWSRAPVLSAPVPATHRHRWRRLSGRRWDPCVESRRATGIRSGRPLRSAGRRGIGCFGECLRRGVVVRRWHRRTPQRRNSGGQRIFVDRPDLHGATACNGGNGGLIGSGGNGYNGGNRGAARLVRAWRKQR